MTKVKAIKELIMQKILNLEVLAGCKDADHMVYEHKINTAQEILDAIRVLDSK